MIDEYLVLKADPNDDQRTLGGKKKINQKLSNILLNML